MSASSYVLLALALLLLLYPRNWLRFGLRVTPKPARKYNQAKVERDIHDRSVKPVSEIAKPRNWLDLFRAMIGGIAVMGIAADLSEGSISKIPLIITASVLALAVVVQMIRIEGRLGLFAPIFYLQGLTFAVLGGLVGTISMVASWALTPVLPSPSALLFVQGAIALCLTLLLTDAAPVLGVIMAGLTWLPVVVAVLVRKRLSASFDKKLKVIPRDARDD